MNGFPPIYSSANIKRNYVPGVPCSHALDTKLKMIKIIFSGEFHSWLWKIKTRMDRGNAMLQVWMKREEENCVGVGNNYF